MAKYVCSICGFVYDEDVGIPESGIEPGTAWEDLPEDWTCPLCGAAISDFEKQDEPAGPEEEKPVAAIDHPMDMQEMTFLEMSALCTNLARGCEKQYKPEESALFNELAEFFKKISLPAKAPNFDRLIALGDKDIEEGFPNAKAVATEVRDRGALRALTWSERVTRMLKSHLNRYKKEGDAMVENTDVHVCTICGFIYIGDKLPDVCPVCKVPNWKFEKIEGR